MSAALIRAIQVGCRQLGIDQDSRRALQLRLTGKESLSDMSDAERRSVLDALKARGFTPAAKSGQYRMAERADIRLIHVLWGALGRAGTLRNPSRKGLNAFIQKRFGKIWGAVPADVDMLSEHKQIEDVLAALSDWVGREVPEFDWSLISR